MQQSLKCSGAKLSNKKHTASRRKAGMRLNNWVNRTDINNQYSKYFKTNNA